MRIGLSSPQDVVAFFVRRRWWIIGPFLMLSLAVGIVVKVMPKTFVSESLILVRPRDIPEKFVTELITGSTEERLKVIEQTVLSRSNIVKLLQEFQPQLVELRPYDQDAKVKKLRSQIKIDIEAQVDPVRQTRSVPYFKVQYQNENPELAQKIAQKITDMFLAEDAQTREDVVYGTREFFQTEFDSVSRRLAESQSRLKELRAGRQFELPEQLDLNQRTLDRLQQEQQANNEQLDRMRNMIINLDAVIAQTPPVITSPLPPTDTARQRSAAAAVAKLEEDPVVSDYLKAKALFDQASLVLAAGHPDYKNAKVIYDKAKAKVPLAVLESLQRPPAPVVAASAPEPEPTAVSVNNPNYLSLRTSLSNAQNEYGIAVRDKDRIAANIKLYNSRVQSTPQTELLLSDLVRQVEDLQKQYDTTNEKLLEAQLSESLEAKQKGAQFFVIDKPNRPLTATKPNKWVVLGAGAGVSLVLAVAFAFLVDIARQRVWSATEVEKFWGAPVLVDVPEILTDTDLQAMRRRKMMFSLYFAGAAAVYSVGLYGLYLKRSFVLMQLDPLLQSLVY